MADENDRPTPRQVLFKDNAKIELKPRHVARNDHAPPGATGILFGGGTAPAPQVPRPPPPGLRPPSPPNNIPRPSPPGLGPTPSMGLERVRPPPPGKSELTPEQKFKRAEDLRPRVDPEGPEKPRLKL